MPDGQAVLLAVTVAVALGFDFTNGFHDTANAVATTISTRALGARLAIGLSAVLNLAGAIVAIEVLHTKVANTIGGLVAPAGGVSLPMIVAALAAAITWNLITWRAGLPSSSSHALIGALIGMGLAGYGVHALKWGTVVPVIIGLITSPVLGFFLGYVFLLAVLHVFRNIHPARGNSRFRVAQIFSGGFVSFSHGANDAQKTMAIITLALLAGGQIGTRPGGGFPAPPLWVVIAAASAIGLGTYAGGWRIIRTMGSRITRLEPVDGFAAQTMAALVIQTATQLAIPVSTTHVVSGAVMGAGATRRLAAVRWGTARNIVVAWVLTIPATALLAAAGALVARAL
ncbi:MAG: inorganic phosphate transporter [Candidatus Dormibacteraeota bacterium]|uniref:Inorganic phosphate transporter n=1 Tax=Candidatus Amunia macphersoniae TaxID=3127014 RepID=A0A934KM96_9BACT|nr:inorganic phosphate transporter [Candidatus Dormibacteraeota bacterium]